MTELPGQPAQPDDPQGPLEQVETEQPTDPRCSALSADADEPLAGTAPTDASWLFVERPGPWGPQALTDSRLDPAVAAHLAGLPNTRVQLIRKPGRDTGDAATGPIRIFAARAMPDGVRVTGGAVETERDLLDIHPESHRLTEHDRPLLLVCANGKRDRCCAERGRPVAAALAERWAEETWETTHLGGHRFAATMLALPSGLVLGRLDASNAEQTVEEVLAGNVPGLLTRGRVGVSAAEQAAELHLLRELAFREVAITGAKPLFGDDGEPLTEVAAVADGERWLVTTQADNRTLRASCEADLKPVESVRVVLCRPY